MKKNQLFYTSIVCYCLSMILPVAELEWGFLGVQAFIMILGIDEPDLLFILPWLANVTYIANLLLRKNNISIRILISVFTIVFSVFALGFFALPFQDKGIFSSYIGPGLIVWMLSFVLMLASQIKEYRKAQKRI